MALGSIRSDENYVYVNGITLHDVQSVQGSTSLNRTSVNVAGIGHMASIHEGVLNGNFSMERIAVNEDPFTGDLHKVPFTGVWEYTDSSDVSKYFAAHSGYLSSYSFNASVGQIPTISTEITAYGNMIGGSVGTGDITRDDDGLEDNFIYPKQIELSYTDGDTNRVQSFNLSFSIPRVTRDRLGALKSIPDTFVAYPIQASLSIDLEVDEYSATDIETLICQDTQDISLTMQTCGGTNIRNFTFESGILNSQNLSASVGGLNTLTLEYVKYINDINDISGILS
tara:strand:+ start:38958 stop:39806 length:849 start_codon:yes stop_codon:yes gene_type:complete